MNGAGNFEWFPEKKVHEVWVGNYLMTPFFLENDLEVKNNNHSDFALKKKHIRDGHGMKWFDKSPLRLEKKKLPGWKVQWL